MVYGLELYYTISEAEHGFVWLDDWVARRRRVTSMPGQDAMVPMSPEFIALSFVIVLVFVFVFVSRQIYSEWTDMIFVKSFTQAYLLTLRNLPEENA